MNALWPEPQPLVERPDLGTFPIDVLPTVVRDMVQASAESIQVPVDLAAMSALGTLAAAVRGRIEVQVKSDHREVVTLYVFIVAESGERKSATEYRMTLPLREYEASLIEDTAPKIAADQAHRSYEEKMLRQIKVNGSEASRAEYEGQAKKVAEIIVEPEPRLLVEDVTPERLAPLLAAHGHLAAMSSEGGLVETITGRRYNDHANLDLVLKAYDGHAYRMDRVREGGTVLIPRPVLTLSLFAQPVLANALWRDEEYVGRGLIPRCLVVAPASRVGTRTWQSVPIPFTVEAAWSEMIKGLAEVHHGQPVATIVLSDPARGLLGTFHDEVERRMVGDLVTIRPWASKVTGATARIAALLHLAERGEGWAEPVGSDHVKAAVGIARHLIKHALYVSEGLGHAPEVRDAQAIRRWIERKAVVMFSTRDAQRDAFSHNAGTKVDRVRAGLVLLRDKGWIAGGVGEGDWLVNPRIHTRRESGDFGDANRTA